MRKHLLAAVLAGLLAPGCGVAQSQAQDPNAVVKVDWTVETREHDMPAVSPTAKVTVEEGKVQFAITRRSGANSIWMHSNTVPVADLRGLSSVALASEAGTPVRFRVDRDAGAFDCEGIARRGRGTGDCTFQPDPRFTAALQQRGIGAANQMQLFSMAMGKVGMAYIEELERQRYARPTIDELVSAGSHGAGIDYLRGMGALGYRAGTVKALVRMRDHGVSTSYVKELADFGIRGVPAEDLVRMRDRGVSARFIGELRQLGYGGLSTEELVRLRDRGVSSSYVRTLAEHGVRGVPAADLVRLRDHGVSASFVGELRKHGYGSLTTADLIRLRDNGVSSSFVGQLRELGYTGLSAQEIVRLRSNNVTPDFIRRGNAAGRRTVDELVRQRSSS